MYRLSLWARHHIWATRFLLVGIYILLHLLGKLLGAQLEAIGIYLTQTTFYVGAGLLLLGFMAYPAKKYKEVYKNFYRLQKSCDAVLISGTFIMMVCLGQPQSLPKRWIGVEAYATHVAPPTEKPETRKKNSFFRKLGNGVVKWMGIDKAIQKKIQKNWQRLQKEYKDSTKGEKTALIILSVLVAIALLMLVASVSCNLSCSGYDGAAVVVGVLGTGLVIFLLVRVIRRISRGPRKRQPANAPPPEATVPL